MYGKVLFCVHSLREASRKGEYLCQFNVLQRIRQVVGKEKLNVFIHITLYHYQNGVIEMDLLINKFRYHYTR